MFDSVFDVYRGVVGYVRVVSGTMEAGPRDQVDEQRRALRDQGSGRVYAEDGVQPRLNAGDVGYFIANIKTTADMKIGDTITDQRHSAREPLPGFQEIHPMVFSGIYPINTGDFEHLKTAIGEAALERFRVHLHAGKLGRARFRISLRVSRVASHGNHPGTAPSRVQHGHHRDEPERRLRSLNNTRRETLLIDNPAHLPDPSLIEEIREPIVRAYVLCPNENIGDILQLILEKRGQMDHTETLDTRRVMLHCELPLNEILVDFNDKIKSITRGYGSMDYEHAGYRPAKLVKLDLLVNGEPVDAFSTIVHKDRAEASGRQLAAKLKEVIPRQLYQVAIQAAIGGKIIARESVSALRKNVTAKCYGGDITRKRKLLEKQKEGKKRMKSIGKINIPQEAFIEVLKAQ